MIDSYDGGGGTTNKLFLGILICLFLEQYFRLNGDCGHIRHNNVHPTIETNVETIKTIKSLSNGVNDRSSGRISLNRSI
jgi:hypothetical protein